MTFSVINTLKISQKCNSASSTIKEKNYDIESLCYKALEIIRSLKSEKTNKRADLIEQLIKSGIVSSSSSSDYDLIQANEVLRWLEDNHEIFLVDDSGLVNVTTYRNISNFDRRQHQVQEEWLGVREFGSSCEIDEEREIRAVEIVREEGQELQQKKKRRQYHRHAPKKQTEQQQQQWEVCFAK